MLWTIARLRAGAPLKAIDIAREFETCARLIVTSNSSATSSAPTSRFDHSARTYRANGSVSLPPVLMSQGEVVALYFAEKILAQYRGTPFESDVARAF